MDNPRVDKLKAFEFLCDNRFGVLSTISSTDYTPQSSLVYYMVDEKSIYIVTTRQSRKLKNILKHNNIAFTIFTEIPPVELQIEGIAEVVSDPNAKTYISKIYMEHANKNPETINWPPILKLPNDEGFEFLKITVVWFKYSDFRDRAGKVIEGNVTDWE